jgi:hypothetical protein
MPLPLALAVDMPPSIPSELRWEAAGIAIGFVLLSVGLAAMRAFALLAWIRLAERNAETASL